MADLRRTVDEEGENEDAEVKYPRERRRRGPVMGRMKVRVKTRGVDSGMVMIFVGGTEKGAERRDVMR